MSLPSHCDIIGSEIANNLAEEGRRANQLYLTKASVQLSVVPSTPAPPRRRDFTPHSSPNFLQGWSEVEATPMVLLATLLGPDVDDFYVDLDGDDGQGDVPAASCAGREQPFTARRSLVFGDFAT